MQIKIVPFATTLSELQGNFYQFQTFLNYWLFLTTFVQFLLKMEMTISTIFSTDKERSAVSLL